MTAIDFGAGGEGGLSGLARGVVGSEILKIAAQIREIKATGAPVCNLTVGDFDPAFFPLPARLLEGVREALAAGHTNYPPSDGVSVLREAVVRFYERELGVRYPVEAVIVAAGARPLIYGAYRTVLDPGDAVLYSVPSWNNNHYVYLAGARGVPVAVGAASGFFPTPEDLTPHLGAARMLVINSPLNPTGTAIAPEALRTIAQMVVEENRRREKSAKGEKALWLLYDQVYWRLTFGGVRHVTPVGLVPEVAPYTIMLDAISKAFAATGLRVGWAVMPPAARQRMADILGHVGAWAPKAEQVATAALLGDAEPMAAFHARMIAGLQERLSLLSDGFAAMKRDGYPVETTVPAGAIYLSARVALAGNTNEQTRRLLLNAGGLGVVPFQAFGLPDDSGWFRLSIGAVSVADIKAVFPRLRDILPRVR